MTASVEHCDFTRLMYLTAHWKEDTQDDAHGDSVSRQGKDVLFSLSNGAWTFSLDRFEAFCEQGTFCRIIWQHRTL